MKNYTKLGLWMLWIAIGVVLLGWQQAIGTYLIVFAVHMDFGSARTVEKPRPTENR